MAERWFPKAGEYAAKSLRAKLKDVQGTKELIAQVSIDQFIHIPFIFYPIYYMTKEVIMTDYNEVHEESLPVRAITKWRNNLYDDRYFMTKINLNL